MTAPCTRNRVLLVDDHRLFAEVLALRLRTDGEVPYVETVSTLAAARAMLNTFAPDVLLLDRHVGDDDGLALLADVAAMPSRPCVLVVSAVLDPSAVVDALDAGADGWIGKDSGLPLLRQAIDTVLRGDMYLPAPVLRPVVHRLLHEGRRRSEERTFLDDLSARETEVLRCLVAGMTRAEAAERLFVSANTVRTHVQNLFKRVGVHSTGALVAAARELGVSGIDEEPPVARGRSSA